MFLWPDSRDRRLALAVDTADLSRARAPASAWPPQAWVSWFDPRWAAIRLMTQVAAVMVTLILLAAVRARDELDASSALAWPLLIGMSVLLLGSAVLWLRYEWRPRRVEQLPTPTA